MKRQGLFRIIFITFVVSGVSFGVIQLLLGFPVRALLGFATPLFYLAVRLINKLAGGPPYLLYIEVFSFCILAYNIGCVMQAFDAVKMLDKVSHFLSGFVFTTLGYCLFLLLRKNRPKPMGQSAALGVSYAVFTSAFVAVVWEIWEFLGYITIGNDSQHHLTTGVFDTMYDLITCMVGSLLCAGSLILYIRRGVKLPAGAIAEEFLEVIRPGGKAKKQEKK